MADYNLGVQYIKGSKQAAADCLSRPVGAKEEEKPPDPEDDIELDGHIPICTILRASEVQESENDEDSLITSNEALIAEQEKDRECKLIRRILASAESKCQKKVQRELGTFAARCRDIDGILTALDMNNEGTRVPVLPQSMRERILFKAHTEKNTGHLMQPRIGYLVRERVAWPSMNRDIDAYLKRCTVCTHNMPSRAYEPEFEPITANRKFEKIVIDATLLGKSTSGPKWALAVVDVFTRWAAMIPLASETASCQIEALKATVFATYGAPETIICDRCTAYNSALFREFCNFYGIELAISKGYSRTRNAIVDRFHRTVKQMVRKSIEKLEDWPRVIHDIVSVYNATRHASTGFAPAYLLAGIQPRLPIDAALQYKPRVESTDYSVIIARNLEVMVTAAEAAAEHRKQREEAQLRLFREKHANKREPKVGDIVYRLSIDWKYRRKSPKLDPIRYYGPYRITALIHPHCKLETLDGQEVSTQIHLAEIHPAKGKRGVPVYPAEDMPDRSSERKMRNESRRHNRWTGTTRGNDNRKRQMQQCS